MFSLDLFSTWLFDCFPKGRKLCCLDRRRCCEEVWLATLPVKRATAIGNEADELAFQEKTKYCRNSAWRCYGIFDLILQFGVHDEAEIASRFWLFSSVDSFIELLGLAFHGPGPHCLVNWTGAGPWVNYTEYLLWEHGEQMAHCLQGFTWNFVWWYCVDFEELR
jgi:hypothetical protein